MNQYRFEVRDGVGYLTAGNAEITLPAVTAIQAAGLIGMVADANAAADHFDFELEIVAINDFLAAEYPEFYNNPDNGDMSTSERVIHLLRRALAFIPRYPVAAVLRNGEQIQTDYPLELDWWTTGGGEEITEYWRCSND